MIHATFPGCALTAGDADAAGRTIAGVAVPYGVPGTIADGRTVIFEPGSLDAATRPLMLRDHDRTRPLGRVVDAADRGDRLEATARVSRTRDGDEALILAADGVLGAFSVGAEPSDFYTDDDGVLRVVAADWHELSLLTFGAFAAARVSTVTAQEGTPAMSDEPVPTEPDEPDEPDDAEPNPDIEPDQPVQTRVGAQPIPITAGAAARHPSSRRPGDGVTLRTLGPLFRDARAGNRRAQRDLQATINRFSVEAALANVTLVGTDNVSDLYRPAYQPEIVSIVSHGAPLTEIIRQGDLTNGDFPNKTFVKWNKVPTVALQSAEKIDVNSTAVDTVIVSVPVQTWATGNDISRQTLDFGSPSFLEEYARAAAVSYATVIDTYAATTLLAAATSTASLLTDSFIQVVGKLFAALNPANVPEGRMFLAIPWAVAAALIPITNLNGPAYWNISLDLGSFIPQPDTGGLLTVVDPNMPANTYLLGLTTAATWYDAPGVPYTLRADDVGKLGVDISVYGYGALGVQYPGALVKTVPA